ncbi:MAG: hypothetical protein LC802_00765 [Acidobacteria bacterium]|nr:hypothetical protein [Acidobacteriota bacterium]
MNDNEIRNQEMFLRVQEFGTAQAARLAANVYAGELFARLGQTITKLETHSATQSSNTRTLKESGASKEAARTKLRDRLEAMSRTAKPLEATMPGITGKFRVPARLKDQELLSLARAVSNDALPLKAEFIKRGLPAGFIEDLTGAVAELEQAVSQKIQTRDARISSTATVKSLVNEGVGVVRELDPIARNVFASDPAALAAWESARRVERTPRRRKAVAETPTPPAPSR